MNNNTICSWSGGKDSCFALMKAIENGLHPKVLLNILNEEGKISRSHGIPAEILLEQAYKADLPMHLVNSSWQEYEQHFTNALMTLKEKYDLTNAVFGDIDLQPHRDWEEKVCMNAGLTAVLPLWQQDRKDLVLQMLAAGIETMIVSCNDTMGEQFIGRYITRELINEMEDMGIDPCGENGEYHTLVLNCPLFSKKIDVRVSDRIQHENYWFSRLQLL